MKQVIKAGERLLGENQWTLYFSTAIRLSDVFHRI